MTFDEARKKHLMTLDKAYVDLREIVSDPKWTNTDYKAYRESQERFNTAVKNLHDLNEVETNAGA